MVLICSICEGIGLMILKGLECKICGGNGVMRECKIIIVDIFVGIEDGMCLCVDGVGDVLVIG